jgi:hypothetical protein
MVEQEAYERLQRQAREDPEFFHALVFDTENTLSKLTYLDIKAKEALLSITPEEVISILVTGGRSIKGSIPPGMVRWNLWRFKLY